MIGILNELKEKFGGDGSQTEASVCVAKTLAN